MQLNGIRRMIGGYMDSLKNIIETIEDADLKTKIEKAYDEVFIEFKTKPAAVRFHHTFPGGLLQHTTEVVNIALDMYNSNPELYKCSKDDVILVSFIHDFNKLYKYCDETEQWKRKKGQLFGYANNISMAETAETVWRCYEMGLSLTELQINAVSYHHGGWAEGGAVNSGMMTPLGVLLHAADMLSVVCFGSKND